MWPFKRKTLTYKPVNRLEKLLKSAANDPGNRGEFMRQIFHYNLYVLGESQDEGVNFETRQDQDGNKTIFAFTSVEALSYALKLMNRGPANYIEIPSHSVFEICKLNYLTLVLNSGHDYGRIFHPDEMESILCGSPEQLIIKEQTEIFLGQPAHGYPDGIVEAIKSFVKKTPSINAIYLGWLVAKSDKSISSDGEYYGAIDFIDEKKSEQVFCDMNHVISDFLNGASMVFCVAKKDQIDEDALLKIEG